MPLLLKNLAHSFLLQNSPFLGAEVIVFFLGIHRLPDRNPCHYLSFHAKKITRQIEFVRTIVRQLITADYWLVTSLQTTSRTNSICPCFIFLATDKSNISSIIKALIALYDALGGDKGMDVLRVVGDLLCQCRLARCQGWLQERIAIARQYYLGGRRLKLYLMQKRSLEQGTESDAGQNLEAELESETETTFTPSR